MTPSNDPTASAAPMSISPAAPASGVGGIERVARDWLRSAWAWCRWLVLHTWKAIVGIGVIIGIASGIRAFSPGPETVTPPQLTVSYWSGSAWHAIDQSGQALRQGAAIDMQVVPAQSNERRFETCALELATDGVRLVRDTEGKALLDSCRPAAPSATYLAVGIPIRSNDVPAVSISDVLAAVNRFRRDHPAVDLPDGRHLIWGSDAGWTWGYGAGGAKSEANLALVADAEDWADGLKEALAPFVERGVLLDGRTMDVQAAWPASGDDEDY